MARTTGRLTALKVERAKGPGMYADGGGLYLQVTEGGSSWIYRFMLNGRARAMGLGPFPLYSLAEARLLAQDARRLCHQGIDPIEARQAAKAQKRLADAKTMTFQQCADAYIASHRPSWRNASHAAQWSSTLATYADPIIGVLPVQVIDTQLVLKVLQQHVEAERGPAGEFWQARPETASRLRGRIENVLDWARVRGYRAGENPARWRGHLDHLLPSRAKLRRVRHHPALPYGELSAFMADLRRREGITARALEFAIVTAGRVGEVIGARWSEFDLRDKTWIVPGARMKAGKAHRVPLSPRALAIVQQMQAGRSAGNDHALVFPGGKPGRPLHNTTMMELLQRMSRGDITAHGFRSTFRDWAAEQTNYPNHVVEQALAHVIGSKVEQARSDLFEKRRRLMQL
jgi:integrase